MLDHAQAQRSPELGDEVLLLGCGYLGTAMLGALGGRVTAVTRSAARHAALGARGVRCVACDLAAPDLAARLAPGLAGFRGVVFLIAPPSAWADDGLAASLARLVAVLAQTDLRCAVLASSTVVFGDAAGEEVAADAPVDDGTPRARKQLAIERQWQAAPFATRVVRLAGLYGPGRVIGLAGLARGEAVAGDGEAWLNLLHVEDAARALIATALAATPLDPALISDGRPLRRRSYYATLATLLGRPAPSFGAPGGRSGGSRRCDPSASWAALTLAPRWPDVRAGLADALRAK